MENWTDKELLEYREFINDKIRNRVGMVKWYHSKEVKRSHENVSNILLANKRRVEVELARRGIR